MPKDGSIDEQSITHLALGQTGSSTRQEISAWLLALTLPMRSNYATDSQSLVDKATQMLQAAKRMQKQRNDGTQIRNTNPFKKPWGVQTDGDVWEQVWEAIQTRGCDNQTVRKVTGHATQIKRG